MTDHSNHPTVAQLNQLQAELAKCHPEDLRLLSLNYLSQVSQQAATLLMVMEQAERATPGLHSADTRQFMVVLRRLLMGRNPLHLTLSPGALDVVRLHGELSGATAMAQSQPVGSSDVSNDGVKPWVDVTAMGVEGTSTPASTSLSGSGNVIPFPGSKRVH